MAEVPARTDEAILRARLRDLVRDRPWLAVAAAAAAGGMLGGIWWSRAGRLAFAATTGFFAHEVWLRQGRFAMDDVVARLARERHAKAASDRVQRPAVR